MTHRIIVHVSDAAVGVEGIPDDAEVEIRLYDGYMDWLPGQTRRQDERGDWYVAVGFRGLDSLSQE